MPELHEVLSALHDAILVFCDTVRASSSNSTGLILGTASSAEIVSEPVLRFGWNAEPVRTAHSLVRLGHFFVIDQLRTLARLATMNPPAVYAPYVVTRSLLDTAGITYWLAEPHIGPEKRVQRRLVSDLLEAAAQRIPDRPELAAKVDEVRNVPFRIEEFCTHHSWQFGNGQPPIVGSETRPNRPQLIGAVIDSDPTAVANGLGGTLWWFLSGHTHGSADALISLVTASNDTDPTRPNALLVVDAVKLVWLLVAAGKAARRVTDRRQALFGDMDTKIESLGIALDRQLLRYLEAAQTGQLPSGYAE